MPRAVQRSVNQFVRSLAEAVLIVLAVSLLSLGLRTGLVVAVSIPLVLAMTFLFMWLFDIGLHKISLGALILSLGLLVDDAIIAVEMMAIKLEQGFDRFRAASFAYTSTAFPMLTGTLITVAGFLPIATAKSGTGEYTRSIFQVSAIALVASWFVAVIVIPVPRLPDAARLRVRPARVARWRGCGHAGAACRRRRTAPPRMAIPSTSTRRRSTAAFAALVAWSVGHRKTVIAITLAAFVAALGLFRLVPQQFFPSSSRPELLVDLRLPEGSSFAATLAEAKKMEAILDKEPGIESYVAYVGAGSPRFYLPLDQQLQQSNFAQFVVIAQGNVERERVRARLITLFENDFPALRGRVSRLENGPPVGFPVQFRVSGEDIAKVRAAARDVMAVMRANPDLTNVQFDWDEPTKAVRLVIDQNKARVLGFTSQDLAAFLNNSVSGLTVTYYRERDKQIEVVVRGAASERAQLSFLKDLAIPSRNGKAVPITQIADIRYELEEGIVWRRDRLPTITVRADVHGDAQGPDVTRRIDPQLDPVRAALPLGYRIEIGGADRGFGARPAIDRRRRAAARARRADAADAPAAELLAHADGRADGAARADRRDAGAARVRQAVRLRRDAGDDRAVGHHHAQFGDPGRPDRPGHRRRALAVGRDHRRDGAPLPADRADRGRRRAGDDPADAQRLLRPDGGRDDGRHRRRDGADAGLPAGALRRVVPRAGRGAAAGRRRVTPRRR